MGGTVYPAMSRLHVTSGAISEYVSKSRPNFRKLNWNPTHLYGLTIAQGVAFGSRIPITEAGFRFPGWRRLTPLWHPRACCFPSTFSLFRLSLPSRHRLSLGPRTSAQASVSPNLSRSKFVSISRPPVTFPSGPCLPPSRPARLGGRQPITPGTRVSNQMSRHYAPTATPLPPISAPPPRSLSF